MTLPPGSDFFSINMGNHKTGKYHFKIARALSITLYAFFVVLQPVSKRRSSVRKMGTSLK